jgi:hypothetical protein
VGEIVTDGLLFTGTFSVVLELAEPHTLVGSTVTEPLPPVPQSTTMLDVPWPDSRVPPETVHVYAVALAVALTV